MPEKNYIFFAEWYDTQASIIRRYRFTYHADDNTVEIVFFSKKNLIFLV